MIDMYSRYTQSVWVPRKYSREILDAVLENWCGIFGIMYLILTDNGGEFTSEEMREVTSFLNIKKYTTAAEAPWQNGLCERVHAVTDHILSKLAEEYPTVRLQTLLKWANMARNALQMHNGFTSHQLVFGVNPNLPNIMNAQLPGLEETTSSETFGKHLNLMQATRQAYIEAENSERIKRALRHRIRSSQETFEAGDQVYYKRDDDERWLGPGKVMFQDGKVVFVRHGSVYKRVSVNRLIKRRNNQTTELDIYRELDDGDFEKDMVDNKENTQQSKDGEDEEVLTRRSDRLKIKDPVDYKALAGKKKDELVETVEYVYITTIPKEEQNSSECLKAKILELEKLKEYKVYDEIPENGQTVLSTRWVMTMKGDKPRARLVVRGFEEEESVQTDSPTVSKCAMRLMFVIAASKSWKIKTTDIKSAFLQGKELDRIVYIKPPKEARSKENKTVWSLKKCLYGLNDASRQFYLAVKEVLKACGCKQSTVEPTLFYLCDNEGSLRGVIVSHIDDFLHGGDEFFETEVITPLVRRFTAGKAEIESFTYVGFQVSQTKDGITVDQSQYINNIDEDDWQPIRGRDKASILTDTEQTQYRSLIGTINWCVRGTRPDLAFELMELSTKMRTATVGDWHQARKCIKKLKSGCSKVFYPKLAPMEAIKLEVYTDASFANMQDGVSSAMGYTIFATDDKGAASLGWRAGKIKRVVKSTLAAEALALSDGLSEAMYIQKMVSELLHLKVPIVAHVDSKGLVDQLHSSKLVLERRLRIDIGMIKEMLERNEVKTVTWCATDKQPADVLTKRGASGVRLLDMLSQGKL